MSAIEATWRIDWRGDRLAKAASEAFLGRLYRVAEELRQKVVDNISGPSPSAPGDFPGTDTGNLKRSIFAEVDEAGFSVVVGSPLKYALYLEYGTASTRQIQATGGALRFVDPRTGEVVFARYVTVGPVRARPFMRRTMAEAGDWMRRALEAALDLPEAV